MVDAFKSLDKYVANAINALGVVGIAIDLAAIVAHLSNSNIDQAAKTFAGLCAAFLTIKGIAFGIAKAVSFVGAGTLAASLSSVTLTTIIEGAVAYGTVEFIN